MKDFEVATKGIMLLCGGTARQAPKNEGAEGLDKRDHVTDVSTMR